MLQGARIAVVVPAYNEALLIPATLRGVPKFVDHVVVVDDASQDGTSAQALAVDDPRVHVLRHDRNRGVGAALRTGYAAAFDAGAEAVVVMAGDGQMDPSDLPNLLAPLLRGEADYVKGDRLSHPDIASRMPRPRWVGNHVLSFLTRVVTGLPVQDSQCGYTVLSRRGHALLSQVRIWSGYGYPNDVLGWLAQHRAPVRDVVVRPVYGMEVSGIRLRHVAFVIPFVLLRILWRRTRALRSRIARDEPTVPAST